MNDDVRIFVQFPIGGASQMLPFDAQIDINAN